MTERTYGPKTVITLIAVIVVLAGGFGVTYYHDTSIINAKNSQISFLNGEINYGGTSFTYINYTTNTTALRHYHDLGSFGDQMSPGGPSYTGAFEIKVKSPVPLNFFFSVFWVGGQDYGYGKIPYFNYTTTVGPNGTIYFGVLWGPVTDITFGNPNIANVTPQQVTVEVIWRY